MIEEEIRKIKQTTKGNILIQGSASIVNLLLQEKLLDVLKLLTNPHIVGSGKRLFESELNQQLVLTHEKQIDNGVIISTYKPKY